MIVHEIDILKFNFFVPRETSKIFTIKNSINVPRETSFKKIKYFIVPRET